MPAPTITPLPTPPSRSQSPDTFSTDADAFLGALPDFGSDANAQAAYLDALATAVDIDATTASNAAAVAAGAANYQGDYSAGTTYQIGESVSYNGRRYVAKTVNTGVTPVDGANWFLINDGDVLGPVSATNNGIALYDGTTGKMLKSGLNNGTAGQALISGGAGNPPVWGAVESGVLSFTATGSISAGQPVVLRSDGTVEAVSGFTQSEATGSEAAAGSQANNYSTTIPLPGLNKIAAIWINNADSYPYASIGDVSGTSITFGTPVQISTIITSSTSTAAAYDPVNNRVVFFWTNGNGGSLYCVNATISGTTLTFGTVTSLGGGFQAGSLSAYYDASVGCIVIIGTGAGVTTIRTVTVNGNAMNSQANTAASGVAMASCYGPGYGIMAQYASGGAGVGIYTTRITITPSTYAITLGSAIMQNSTAGNIYNASITYAPSIARFFVVYGDTNTPDTKMFWMYDAATASYGLISFDNSNFQSGSVFYDALSQKVFVSYRTAASTTIKLLGYNFVSDTFSLSINQTSFASSNNLTQGGVISSGKIYVGYPGTGYRAKIYQPYVFSTNANGFIGIAKNSVSTGQSVNVTVAGGVNTNVSGLTANANYYVTFNGLFATSGIAKVGRALSATSIFVEERLAATGTPSATTFLRGDGAWAVGGAQVPLSTTVISGNPTAIDITGLSGYRVYLIDATDLAINGTTSTDTIAVNFYTGGVLRNSANTYFFNAHQQNTSGSVLANNYLQPYLFMQSIWPIGSYSRSNLSFRMLIFGGDQSALAINFDASCTVTGGAGNGTSCGTFRGYFRNDETQTFSGIRILNVSSATFNRGTIKVYGIA